MLELVAIRKAPCRPPKNEREEWLVGGAVVNVLYSMPVEEHPFMLKRIILSLDPIRNVIADVGHVDFQILCCESDWRISKTGCLLASSTKSLSGAPGSTLK